MHYPAEFYCIIFKEKPDPVFTRPDPVSIFITFHLFQVWYFHQMICPLKLFKYIRKLQSKFFV